MKIARTCTTVFFLLNLSPLVQSCASGGSHSISGNEGGSQPNNQQEVNEYKRAVNKCYRTGGTRVVKIEGKLRCY